jgi:carboxypeptidase D
VLPEISNFSMFSVLLIVQCLIILCNARRLHPTGVSDSNVDVEIISQDSRRLQTQHLQGSRNTHVSSSSSHKVTSLPGLAEDVAAKLSQYAGYLNIDAGKKSNIFYWLIEKPEASASAPLVIWLNGGPGCSSMDGLFLELGPFRLDGKNLDNIKINPYSWHNTANMLFVDQPIGTGFSYTESNDGYAKNDNAINIDFYTFLVKFFTLHESYSTLDSTTGIRTTRPVMFTGESHAGHYIPNMISHILEKNNEKNNKLIIDVKAAALGNPWIDPATQYDASEFAHGMGLISKGQMYNLKEMHKRCQTLLKSGRLSQKLCFELLDVIIDSTAAPGGGRLLMYDARKFSHHSQSFPPGHEAVERYLSRSDVKGALHVQDFKNNFLECTDPPYNALAHQDGLSAVPSLIKVLDAGIRVLVYSGQYDLICNHVSSENVLNDMAWKGQAGFQTANSGVWIIDNAPAGYIREFQNLQSLLCLNSGHMFPMDQPKAALDMFTKWINNKPFSVGTTKLMSSDKVPDENCHTSHRRTSESPLVISMDSIMDVNSPLRSTFDEVHQSILNSGAGGAMLITSFMTVSVVLFIAISFFIWRTRCGCIGSQSMKK